MRQNLRLCSARRILLRTILFSVAFKTVIGAKDKENDEKAGEQASRGLAASYFDPTQTFGNQPYQGPHPNVWPQDQHNGRPNAAPEGFQRPGFQGNGVSNPSGYSAPGPPQFAYANPQAQYIDPRPNQGRPNNAAWPQTQQSTQTNPPGRINGTFGNFLASGVGGFVGGGLGTFGANAFGNNGLHGGGPPHLSGPHVNGPHLNAPQVGIPYFATDKERKKWLKKQKKMLKKQKKHKKYGGYGKSSSSSSSSSDSS